MLLLSRVLAVLVIAVVVAGCDRTAAPGTNRADDGRSTRESEMQRVRTTRTIRAGWAPYPPYAMRNMKSGEVDGFYPALFERGMSEANVRVEWVETTWSNMIADMKAGRFAVMAAPVFRTPARAVEVGFTREISRFGLSALVLAENAAQFRTLDDFDRADVTISVVIGEVGEDFAARRLPRATLVRHSGGNISVALLDVLQGHALAGLTDGLTIAQFEAEHRGRVVDVFKGQLNQVGAGWFVAPDQLELRAFLDTTIDWLDSSGVTAELAREHGLQEAQD